VNEHVKATYYQHMPCLEELIYFKNSTNTSGCLIPVQMNEVLQKAAL